jgi:quercetin dioxygenase-like cupin family protein
MQMLPKQPTVKAPNDNFIGDAWYDTLIRGEAPSRIRVSVVRFAPRARNAWHSHAVGQTVHVTEGVGLIQSRGQTPAEIRPGDTVHTPPGEWHWHGAAPEQFMTHLAMWEASAKGKEAEWGDQVSDPEYLAAAREATR